VFSIFGREALEICENGLGREKRAVCTLQNILEDATKYKAMMIVIKLLTIKYHLCIGSFSVVKPLKNLITQF